MTEENAECQSEFNEIRLKIQLEVQMKTKKYGMLHIQKQFVIFDEFFSGLKSVGKTG